MLRKMLFTLRRAITAVLDRTQSGFRRVLVLSKPIKSKRELHRELEQRRAEEARGHAEFIRYICETRHKLGSRGDGERGDVLSPGAAPTMSPGVASVPDSTGSN